jgi:hypothetical protein
MSENHQVSPLRGHEIEWVNVMCPPRSQKTRSKKGKIKKKELERSRNTNPTVSASFLIFASCFCPLSPPQVKHKMSKSFWNSVKPFFPEKSHIASTFQTLKQQQHNQDQQPAQDERYNYNFANLINLRQVSTIEIARRRTITTQKQDLKRNKLQPGSLCWVKPSTKKRSSTTQPYWPSIVLSNDDLVFKLKSPSTQLGVLCLGIKREQMYGLVADIVPWVDGELKQLWNNGGVTKKMSSGTAKRWLHALWQAEFIEEQGYFPEDTDELT